LFRHTVLEKQIQGLFDKDSRTFKDLEKNSRTGKSPE